MKVRLMKGESGSENEQENDYTFELTNENKCSSSKNFVEIGGVSVKMLTDSGASYNTVNQEK